MGRPLKSKFFFNPDHNPVAGSTVSAIGWTGTATGVTAGNIAMTIGAPTQPGGVNATAYATGNAGGYITAITITNGGTGYTTAPTVAITGVTGLTYTVTLAQPAGSTGLKIQLSSWVPAGTSAKPTDILKQESSSRYRVQTSDGTGTVKLVAGTPAAGEATLIATDVNGSTYYVTKLTAHHAHLTQQTVGTSFEFATGSSVQWTQGAASTGIVSIASA